MNPNTEVHQVEALETLPVLPLRSAVLFPYVTLPISAGRAASTAAIEAALETESRQVLVVTQRDRAVEEPRGSDCHTHGTRAVIRKAMRLANGSYQVMVEGLERAVLLRYDSESPYLRARFRDAPVEIQTGPRIEAFEREVHDLMAGIIALSRKSFPSEIGQLVAESAPVLPTIYAFGAVLSLDVAKQQALLEAPTLLEALTLIHSYLTHETKVVQLRKEISHQAHEQMTKEQREFQLRQELRAIQKELGDTDNGSSDAEAFRKRLETLVMPEKVRTEVVRDIDRLEGLPQASPEYGMLHSYLDFLLDLPWGKSKTTEIDLALARKVLEEDHFGLKEIKERIVEYLGVLKLNPGARSPILCFVGPPGVGKTSLGQSISRAVGRPFERMSLGGLHDEAELRGHRRTYIGAMPGRILKAIRRSGVDNPVLMLDEVDKVGRDWRGDPAAALLEVLDPEQNREFRDNFLDHPFDLSKVLFVATANSVETIPEALLDRLEVIRLSGYSEEEKIEIARRYLIPKQLQENGLGSDRCFITDEAIRKSISGYTREAGVRNLSRLIGKIARKIAARFAEGKEDTVTVGEEDLTDLLGPEKFFIDQIRKDHPPGVAQGLAWTPSGGEVLYIEATLLPQGEGLTLTGQLGDVMQESARTARSHIWSHARNLGIQPRVFKQNGLHVHVPAGAIPKDGPSAGVALAAALTSLLTSRSLRADTAMSGELTLTGLVLPVGGIKEKVLAARRAGVRRVILPAANRKDLRELPDYVRNEMEFIFAEKLSDVLEAALEARCTSGNGRGPEVVLT